eukprot:scaffold95475_cov20-Tisochrysis_lutea.AAC.3
MEAALYNHKGRQGVAEPTTASQQVQQIVGTNMQSKSTRARTHSECTKPLSDFTRPWSHHERCVKKKRKLSVVRNLRSWAPPTKCWPPPTTQPTWAAAKWQRSFKL